MFEEDSTREAYMAARELLKSPSRDLPILCEPLCSPGYCFAGKLKEEYLLCAADELESEATVVGKITRLIPRGQSEGFGGIATELTGLMKLMNRKQRRKAASEDAPELAFETIKGPAAILAITAVFV